MSHHTEVFSSVPSSFLFDDSHLERLGSSVELLVHGQGVFVFGVRGGEEWNLSVADGEGRELRLVVAADTVSLYDSQLGLIHRTEDTGAWDPECLHWFSLDSCNRVLKYGRGEVRERTAVVRVELDGGIDRYGWLDRATSVGYSSSVVPREILRDPVVVDPPLMVVPFSLITIDDIAKARATVPANLTEECRQLYYNVAGENFRLDTPDFPEFVDAVEASIRNPEGWCNRRLREKATEFGEENPEETYLRITVGRNQGESPGIPYVIEIWPPGHYSPIHSHANTHAIIKVLTGEIAVSLYPMLSRHHDDPFLVSRLRKNDVTWISPRFNQTHQLRNADAAGPVCITVQCYMYGRSDRRHYNYFDYIDERGDIRQFVPNSDAGFLEFKAKMRREWEAGFASTATGRST